VTSPCPRCGQTIGLSRWCGTCGQDLRPDLPPSDIPEARQAELLERRWQEQHGGGPEPRPEEPQAAAAPRDALSGGFLPPAGSGPTSFGPPMYVPPAPGGGFRSPRSAALVAAITVGLTGLLTAACLAIDLVWLARVDAAASYETVLNVAEAMDTLSVIQLVAFLAGAVAFIVWFHRAYGNLPTLGIVKPRHARGWAIGAWFVPFANLVVPKQIANDIWRAGDPELDPGEADWRKRRVAGALHLWWAAYLVSGALIRIGTGMLDDAAGFEQARDAVTVDAIGQGLAIFAAVAAIWVIWRSSERQEARASAMRAAQVQPASA
jgi:Domain of unknown function (DUF4328)